MVRPKMLPMVVYTALAAAGIFFARTIGPTEVLASPHHRRLYWTGAVAMVGLVGACVSVLAS